MTGESSDHADMHSNLLAGLFLCPLRALLMELPVIFKVFLRMRKYELCLCCALYVVNSDLLQLFMFLSVYDVTVWSKYAFLLVAVVETLITA